MARGGKREGAGRKPIAEELKARDTFLKAIKQYYKKESDENLRCVLRDQLRIDLDSLADTHRMRVSQPDRWATIDFRNASDSISLKVIETLFPRWFVQLLRNRRSEYILGLDGQWYKPLKLSSMGNGFTFEVMSFLLTVIARSFDQEASSFGDDVVIHPGHARDFIMRAAEIGFVVNEEKSFIGLTDPFRESCGANYHKDHGYISSFDLSGQLPLVSVSLFLTKHIILVLATKASGICTTHYYVC